jgi:biopolymer transport protein TolR
MAGGMDLGTGKKGGKKPLDAAINLVPFIDLMAVTISFLIMTAVWTQISRLQVSQSGGPSSDTPPDDKALNLTLVVTERGYTINASGATYADIPKASGGYDVKALDEKLKALHTNYPDQHAITVQSEDKVKYVDLVKVIDECVGNKLDAVSVSAAG